MFMLFGRNNLRSVMNKMNNIIFLKFLGITFVLFLIPFALLADTTLSEMSDFKQLLKSHQINNLPSPSVVTQNVGRVYIDKTFDKIDLLFQASTDNVATLLLYEEYGSGDVVLTNIVTGSFVEIESEENYDPMWIGREVDKINESYLSELVSYYDPSLIVVLLDLVKADTSSIVENNTFSDNSLLNSGDIILLENTPQNDVSLDLNVSALEEFDFDIQESMEFPGYALGTIASYFEFPQALSSVPNFSQYTPSLITLESNVNHPDATQWEGLPFTANHKFGAVYEFELFAPYTGYYTFRIQSDDGSLMYIDGDLFLNNDGIHGRESKSDSIRLTHGFHHIVVEYFDEGYRAGLQLFWDGADFAEQIIPSNNVYHIVGQIDIDSDGMPDWWENHYGFNPNDGSDATLDADEDSVSNLSEYNFGTNPLLADTDSDGMTDGRELNFDGFDPVNALDAVSDFDGDGLNNIVEFQKGSNPNNKDTDGDGFSDYEELKGMESNPLVAEFSPNWIVLDRIVGSDILNSSGDWFITGNTISSFRRGSLDYKIELNAPDKLFLNVKVSHFRHLLQYSASENNRTRFYVYMGDLMLGVAYVDHTPGEEPSSFRVVLPYLPAGEHDIRVVWDNTDSSLGVCVHDLFLEKANASDSNNDGIEDWILDQSTSNNVVPSIKASIFSPVCVEGTATYPTATKIIDGSQEIMVSPTGAKSWYKNIDLSSENKTVQVVFEDGIKTNSLSLIWSPFNVCKQGDTYTARIFDKLLLTASQSTEIYVKKNGIGQGTISLASGTQYVFNLNDTGTWILSADPENGITQTHIFQVIRGVFPANEVALMPGVSRSWPCPQISNTALISSDAAVSVTKKGSNIVLITKDILTPHYLVSRVSENGPILDSAKIRPFWLRAIPNGVMYHTEDMEGVKVIEDDVYTFNVPEYLTLKSTVVLAGPTFDDYTVIKNEQASIVDFADHWKLRFFQPETSKASVCHSVQVLQDGVLIGDALNNVSTMPEEVK